MKKVCIQGLGFVGSAMATAVASARDINNQPLYDVVGIDINTEEGRKKINSLNQGKLLFFCEDDYLKEKLFDAVITNKNLMATSNVEEYKEADIILVDVGLDVHKNLSSFSKPVVTIERFENAIRSFAKLIKPECLVIIETTVPPGTSKNIVERIIKEEFKIRNISQTPLICHSYERVTPGKNYLKSITHFWRNYSSNNEISKNLAKDFFKTIIAVDQFPLTYIENTTSTEIAKVLENSYRAMNIAFIQEWTELAEEMGVNLFEVIDSIKKRKGTHDNMMKPGFGVGGYCLPKDALLAQWSLNKFHEEKNLNLPLTLQAISINDKMPEHTFKRIKQEVNLENKRVLIKGVSYMSDVEDVRNSPSKVFYDLIKKENVTCKVSDPIVNDYLNDFSPEDIVRNPLHSDFDIIVFAVRHNSYLTLNITEFSQSLKQGCLIVDTFNVLDDDKIKYLMDQNFKVIGIGKGHIKNLK